MLYGKSRKVLNAIRFLCSENENTSTLDITIYLKKQIYDEDLRGCIRLLNNEGYIKIIEDTNLYIRVSLTHKGKHFDEYEKAEYKAFFIKSILAPIIVSLATTLITLWINGLLGS